MKSLWWDFVGLRLLREGTSILDNASENIKRWSVFRSFVFVLMAALVCWLAVGGLVYTVVR